MSNVYGTRSLREIVRILFEHWFIIVFIVALGTAGTWYLCENVLPRKYRSQTSLVFKRPSNKNPLNTDATERSLEVFVKAQQQIVMSDLVLARTKVIAGDPALYKQWTKLRADWISNETRPDGQSDAAVNDIIAFLSDKKVTTPIKILLEQNQEQFLDFRKSVKLETPGGEQVGMTETFTLTVDLPADRQVPGSYRAAEYAARTLADMYLVRYQELQQALNDPAERLMQGVVDNYHKEYAEKEEAYNKFIHENASDIGVLEQLLRSGTEHGIQVLYTKFRESDATLFLELARDKALFEVMKSSLPKEAFVAGGIGKMSDDQVANATSRIPSDFLKENVVFIEHAKNITTLSARLAQSQAQFTDSNKDLRYLREQVSAARRQLLEGIVAHALGLEASIKARQQQKTENEKLIVQAGEERSKVQSNLAEYARLKNEFEVAQKHRERLEQEKVEAMTTRVLSREPVNISRLDDASVPDEKKPVSPQTLLYTIIAGLASLLVALALAFLGDHFNHTLRSSIDAERYLGVPVLGSVKKRGRRLIVPA
jgi:capsular polysaccharide biosynthesis protein